jgi:hypothetical protein
MSNRSLLDKIFLVTWGSIFFFPGFLDVEFNIKIKGFADPWHLVIVLIIYLVIRFFIEVFNTSRFRSVSMGSS